MNDLEAASTPADDGSTGHIEEYGIKSLPPAVVDAEKGEKDALAAQQEEEKGRIAAFLGNIRSLSTKNVEHLNPIHQASVYAANPFTNSILFILALDFLERFAFYGVIFTMPGYLTGYYQPLWNPHFAPFQANGFIAMSQGIGFITPFFTALVADVLIGDYWSINFFTGLCYIPGLILVAVCAIPYAGDLTHFPLENLKIGTHILFPLGFGAAKTLYGVYAAKQYDPIHHADQIEKFFVIFTGVEFIGSFLGGAISIIIADLLKQPRSGLIIAEFINVGALTFGLIIFLLGSGRYMKDKLMRKTYGQMFRSLFEAILCFGGSGKGFAFPGFSKTKQSKGGRVQDSVVDGMVQIILLFPVFLLILPNNVAFTQAVVINITTTSYMKGFGVFKGPMLVATSLLFIGLWAFLMKRYLAPFLQKKGIKLSIADRFALGSFFLGCSYAISAIMSYEIKRAYLETGSQVNIFYGLFGTFLSGGVAFHFSAMNEIAFTVAPAELKMLGTAIMLFMTQGIPNLIGSILFKACRPWFIDSAGNPVRTIQHFVDANSVYFTFLMMGMSLFNVLLMLIPPVKRWISRVEEKSIANNAARAQGEALHPVGNIGDDDNDDDE